MLIGAATWWLSLWDSNIAWQDVVLIFPFAILICGCIIVAAVIFLFEFFDD